MFDGLLFCYCMWNKTHQTFRLSHRKCPTCPTVFINTILAAQCRAASRLCESALTRRSSLAKFQLNVLHWAWGTMWPLMARPRPGAEASVPIMVYFIYLFSYIIVFPIYRWDPHETTLWPLRARRRLGAEPSVAKMIFSTSVYMRDPHDKG